MDNIKNIFVYSDNKVSEALQLLGDDKVIALDTETAGLDAYTCPLWSIQLGNRNGINILFPYNALNEGGRNLLREYLHGKTILAHNCRFDFKMLKVNGFRITSAWDTLNTEKAIYAGKYFTFSLKEVVKRRFGVSLDKEVVRDFYDGTFEALINEKGTWAAWEQKYIDYGLDDIRYLFDIYDSQVEEAKELDMENVVWLENKLVIVNGNQELKGVWLDKAPVKKFAAEMSLKRDTVGLEINSKLENAWRMVWQKEYASRLKIWNTWKIQHDQIKLENSERDPNDKRKKTTAAKAAVEASNKKKPFVKIPDSENAFNPKSPIKLKAALSELTKFPLETTKHDWLEENMDLHPVIGELIEYRKYEKLAQFTEIVTLINPVTGRLHPEINLIRTGRESYKNPNLQQIPIRTEEGKQFRGMFKAAKGNKLVGADYAGIELVILAELSNEKVLLDAINEDRDLHCNTISLILGCPYELVIRVKEQSMTSTDNIEVYRENFEKEFSLAELTKEANLSKWVKKLREYIKTITYGVVYGLSEFGLMTKFHCSFDEAKRLRDLFFKTYPNMKKFLDEAGYSGLNEGYAKTPLGRRRWFSFPKQKSYTEVEAGVIKTLDKQKRIWESVTEDEWDELIDKAIKEAERELKSRKNTIRRQAANMKIQGCSADITKLAKVLIQQSIPEEQGQIILSIHDELWVECREEYAETAKEILEKDMTRAAKKFLPTAKIAVEANICDSWEK